MTPPDIRITQSAPVQQKKTTGALGSQSASELNRAGRTRSVPNGSSSAAADLLAEALEAHRLGDFSKSERLYRSVLRTNPTEALVLNNLAMLLGQRGAWDEAEALARRAVAIKSDYAAAHLNLGNILIAQKQYPAAIAAYRDAIALQPDFAEAHSNLGTALQATGKHDEAVNAYQQALAIKPDYAEAHSNLGIAHKARGDLDKAIASFRHAIAVKPDFAVAYGSLGNALREQGNIDEAIEMHRQAIALRIDSAEGYSNLGVTLHEKGEIDEAIAVYRSAITIKTDHAEAYSNLGIALTDKGCVDEAIASYRRAIALKPDYAEAHFNLSLTLLMKGEFAEGWREYEWRWKGGTKNLKLRKLSEPQWQGEDLSGKTLLIHAEQGHGDALQFVRFAPMLKRQGARVILEIHAPLVALARATGLADMVVPLGSELPDFDFHLPLLSAPEVLGVTEANIPAEVPYLRPDPASVSYWREELETGAGLKVGLAWAGSRIHRNDRNRSITGERLQPLLSVPGVRWFSLQVGERAGDIGRLGSAEIVDLSPQLTDFAKTAAVMANLDLIITVDTAVAHLAGALGRQFWVLLPFSPDFRWMLNREDSPWYPTARLFRQCASGDWDEVVTRIRAELCAAAGADPSARNAARPRTPTSLIETARAEFLRGVALQKGDRVVEAIEAYKRAVEFRPNYPAAYFNLGIALHAKDQIDDAITSYTRAIAGKPAYAEAHFGLASALAAKGKIEGAITAYERAIAVNPDYAEAYSNLSLELGKLHRMDEAIASAEHAVMLRPALAEAHANLGIALKTKGEIDRAIEESRRAIALKPDVASFHFNLGNALADNGTFEDAIAEYRRAIALKPDYAKAFVNLGKVCAQAGLITEAINATREALAIKPDHAEALSNLGACLSAKGAHEQAIAAYRQAIAIEPTNAPAHFNLSLALLLKGEFAEGWREYEWRWRGGSPALKPRKIAKPQWRGEELAGRTLLVHAEQGLGDTLQFIRFVPELAARGGRIVIVVDPKLATLLRAIPGAAEVIPGGVNPPDFDLHLPLMSAPLMLGIDEAAIPAKVPYIEADPVRVEQWRRHIGGAEGLRVGLVWAGNPGHGNDQNRSIAIERLRRLFELSGIRWFGLQIGERASDAARLPEGSITDLSLRLIDFTDTAAALVNLDLIVTVDTAVAHLAGALGRPVWTLLPFMPDWRWQLDRGDSPWYPTMRLFRQSGPGDWDHVVETLATELAKLASGAERPETSDQNPSVRDHHAKASIAGERIASVSGAPATTLKQCRHGLMLFLKNDRYVGRSLDLYGEFSEFEAQLFTRLVSEGDVVVEVGANIGAHSVHLARLVGRSGLMYALEPQHFPFQILCANIALNSLLHVRTINAAVGRHTSTIKLPMLDYAAEENFGGVSLNETSCIGEDVRLCKLDDISFRALKLLKIDVEGMEIDVLAGARETIGKFRPVIYVENDRDAHSARLISLLSEFDYEMWWHLPLLYNPDNFEKNQVNVFGKTISINLLCFPKEAAANPVGLRRVTDPRESWRNALSP